MKVRVLNGGPVTRLPPMAECVEVMAEALATLAGEDALVDAAAVARARHLVAEIRQGLGVR